MQAGFTTEKIRSKSPVKHSAHNRFHYNCCNGRKFNTVDEVKAKSIENAKKRRESHLKHASDNQHMKQTMKAGRRINMVTEESVQQYLLDHPDFLESFILQNVPDHVIHQWLDLKRESKDDGNDAPLTDFAPLSDDINLEKHSKTLSNLITSFIQLDAAERAQIEKKNFMIHLADFFKDVTEADVSNVYTVDESKKTLKEVCLENTAVVQSIGSGSTFAAYVAMSKEHIRGKTEENDPRFPVGIHFLQGNYEVQLFPHFDQHVQVIFELVFSAEKCNDERMEKVHSLIQYLLTWTHPAFAFFNLAEKMTKQKELNLFLMNVVKSIFVEMVSMDTLIIKIMNFAQKLVNADRASLFLVDSKTNQLYARIFDVNAKKQPSSENQDLSREIRFPVGIGIAGWVAETGETLCIPDAYKDPRFNKSVDEQTGYQTKSVLCMPICIRGQVIGIVQMVNKAGGLFTKDDQEAFELFSVYCGLALHHAKLYDKIRRSEQKYKVALEVLSYHNSSSVAEIEDVLNAPLPKEDLALSSFSFYALNLDDVEKVRKALFMFIDLFGLERFDYETLVRFLLTVKKNYRQVAYHNWTHGFHVANSIYSILKSSPEIFTPLESLSMFIGAICHDLDHRGFNNKFMIDVGSPLAAIYSTSTMEHHHFNMTVTILQQENHNIFAKLNPEEYRQVLGNIKHCILATDLALFFPNKARLANILHEGAFSWDLPDHRMLVQSISMTGSDLCSAAKGWDSQESTSEVIYREFYEQGDVEKSLGWRPIPLFDRDHAEEVASMQVGFIGGICLPCYDLLVQVLPATKPLQEQCSKNLETWKQKSEQRKRELEEMMNKEKSDDSDDKEANGTDSEEN